MLNQIDLSRTDLNLLVLYEAVLEEGHVGRAAARLNLTPSAVSHGLGRLRTLLNDPLFLKHPKGVVPTERGAALSADIADILARVRGVVATGAPFDPARSTRRFTIGASDAVSAVVLPSLLAAIGREAPHVGIRERVQMPQQTYAALDARDVDVALQPVIGELPARFHAAPLYDELFDIVMRKNHPLAKRLTLETYCEASHLLVSATDERGFVDGLLSEQGLSRRVAVTAPTFVFALAILAETDLLAAAPKRLAEKHAARFGLVYADAPFAQPVSHVAAIATKAAMADAGIAWLVDLIANVNASAGPPTPPSRDRRPARRLPKPA